MSLTRRYLPEDHYFRAADAAFDGEANHEMESEPLTGNQTIRRGYESEAYIDGGGMEKDEEFPAKVHGVKRVSALYELPYWRVSSLHNIYSIHNTFRFFNFLYRTCSIIGFWDVLSCIPAMKLYSNEGLDISTLHI